MYLINTKRLGFLQKFWLPAFSPISLSPHHSLFISPSFSTSLNPFLTLSLPSLLLFHPSVSSYLPSLSLPLHLPTLPLPQILTPFLSISLSLPISSLSHPLPFPFLSPYSALHSLSLSLIPFSLSFKLTIPITQKWQTDLTYLCESVDPSLVPGIRCPMVGNLYTVTIAPQIPNQIGKLFSSPLVVTWRRAYFWLAPPLRQRAMTFLSLRVWDLCSIHRWYILFRYPDAYQRSMRDKPGQP